MVVLKMPKDILTDADKALFRHMTQDVVPLKKNTPKDTSKKEATKPIQAKQKENASVIPSTASTPSPSHTMTPKITTIHLSDTYLHEVQAETHLSYCQHPIPRPRFSALKKGQIPWEKKLDMHGLKPVEASEKLIRFIHEASQQGLRSLLIIHGKGGRNPETAPAPVLKNLVNHWLQQMPQVLAFCSALAKDGGTGAVYVLLKRYHEQYASSTL